MPIVWQAINEPNPDPTNLRPQNKKQIGQITRSIPDFGFERPDCDDRYGNVIAVYNRLPAYPSSA